MKKIVLLICFCFIAIVDAQCWKSVSAGSYFTMAIKDDGTLWAWGNNSIGQLGDGTTVNRSIPTQIGNDNNWESVSTSFLHTLAIKTDGSLWSWGRNDSGVLGYVDVPFSSGIYTTPKQVGSSTDWKSVFAGFVHTVAIKKDNTLWAWGRVDFIGINSSNINTPMQISSSPVWVKVAMGYTHTILLKNDGTLWAAGQYVFGQLGLGTSVNTSNTNPLTQVGSATNWNSISAAQYTSFATKSDGTLWGWGHNNNNQLGDGSTTNKISPSQIGTNTDWQNLFPSSVTENDSNNTFVLKNDYTIWGWGNNNFGQLGDGTTINKLLPTQIGTNNDWLYATGGDYHTMFLKIESDNTLFGVGYNNVGAIGNGTTSNSSTPQKIDCNATLNSLETDLKGITSISPNPNHGTFSINSNNKKVTQVHLFSAEGKLIYSQKPNKFNPEINISKIVKGIYFLKITLENGETASNKIMIK